MAAPTVKTVIDPITKSSPEDTPDPIPPQAPAEPPRPAAKPEPLPRDMTFKVTLWCEKHPWTGGDLVQSGDITLTAANGVIAFERLIHWPTLRSPVIGIETGEGMIDA
jgi:hypothetical protein